MFFFSLYIEKTINQPFKFRMGVRGQDLAAGWLRSKYFPNNILDSMFFFFFPFL